MVKLAVMNQPSAGSPGACLKQTCCGDRCHDPPAARARAAGMGDSPAGCPAARRREGDDCAAVPPRREAGSQRCRREARRTLVRAHRSNAAGTREANVMTEPSSVRHLADYELLWGVAASGGGADGRVAPAPLVDLRLPGRHEPRRHGEPLQRSYRRSSVPEGRPRHDCILGGWGTQECPRPRLWRAPRSSSPVQVRQHYS
ncbi:hypothetical protein Mnod_8139 (plasmid) [Methylobacterium nodulans ORS 2060]|uniref:Uncharacterized protein n=1 Tax=Methylobacterium nodulans (strain LMG 21967 / CNCM I-2342 / ORS 2060) TaxID=460265 RepID=B8IX80_METNO|nr:hypothetical protein Mnod_8139 [Methylobacterium nodulans ORS 2060]